MLAAAEFLFQVTWLPDDVAYGAGEGDVDILFGGNMRNMEHIAAASAMTQSILLGATEAGLRTYWSSGGVLRSREVFDHLGIPEGEILLGAVFLFPDDVGESHIKPGKLRELRGTLKDWSVWCEIDP